MMKASIKFREDRPPLLSAKVPVGVLGLPFICGGVAAAGEVADGRKASREVRLDVATGFSVGPSLRLSYRPTDPRGPFSVVLKIGVGDFGSPSAKSPLSMSAEFGLLGPRPTFSLFLKPRFGDFAFRNSVSSAAPAAGGGVKVTPVDEGHTAIVNVRPPSQIRPGGKLSGFLIDISALTVGNGGGIEGLLSGFEVSARTALPIAARTGVHFHWGLRAPPKLRAPFDEPTAGIMLRKLPVLAINKISIEHSRGDRRATENKKKIAAATAEAEDACGSMRREVAALQSETRQLGKAVAALQADIGSWKLSPEASPMAWKRDCVKPLLEKVRMSEDMSKEPVKA